MINQHRRIRNLTVDALFLAIMIIMTTVPYIGFIEIPPVSITFIHLVVFVGAYYGGWKKGLLYGLFFGCVSFVKALSSSNVMDVFFVNPLISIVPRVIFGLTSGLVFDLIRHFKNLRAKKVAMIIATLCLTLVHSLLVLTILGLLEGPGLESITFGYDSFWSWMGFIILTNGLGEALVAAVLILPIGLAVEKTLLRSDA